MEKSLGRFVVLAYIAAAVCLMFVFARIFHAGFFYLNVEDRSLLSDQFLLSDGVGLLLSFVLTVVAYKSKSVHQFSLETASELSKVTWPSKHEVWMSTIVVIVTVIISAIFLGLCDSVWMWASNKLLSLPQGGLHG